MDPTAADLLAILLSMGESHEAGARQQPASLTAYKLKPYRELTQLARKEAVEAAFKAASALRLVEIIWDGRERDGGFIERVNIVDTSGLARFLGMVPAKERHAHAARMLEPHLVAFPVLNEVLDRWGKLKSVRGMGPQDAAVWRDAAVAIDWARAQEGNEEGFLVLRNASAAVFRDSKRMESITPAIDVLLAESASAPPREASEVWAELGLAKEEQPVRLAGRIVVVRERVTGLLDAPYSAFPVSTVQGVVAAGAPHEILTIENLTTFHQEARRRNEEPVLLIYTGGAPSPAWRAMYVRILGSTPTTTQIRHWGDVDEGGFRIAAQIANLASTAGRRLDPHRMHPRDVPAEARRPAPRRTLELMRHFAREAGWEALAEEIDLEHGYTVEQEALPQ